MLSVQDSLNKSECRLRQQQDEVVQRDQQHSEELRQCSDSAEERIRELQVDLGAKQRELQSVRWGRGRRRGGGSWEGREGREGERKGERRGKRREGKVEEGGVFGRVGRRW